MHIVPRTALAVATAATLIAGGGFAVAVATPSHGGRTANPATCSSIRTTLGGTQGGAGSLYQNIRFTNTGSVGCRLAGHPNVAYVNAHKHLVGWPLADFATARKGAAPDVVIPPGHAAAATMRIPDYQNFLPMDCVKFNAHQIRVSIPGNTTFLRWDQTECTSKYARSYVGQVYLPR